MGFFRAFAAFGLLAGNGAVCLVDGTGQQGSKDTCEKNGDNLVLPLSATQTSLTFKCGRTFTSLDPGALHVYSSADPHTKLVLATEIPGATLQSQDNAHTLTVPDPQKRPIDKISIVYYCVKKAATPDEKPLLRIPSPQAAEEKCKVTIEVDGRPPVPDDTVTCEPGQDKTFKVSKAETELKLKCEGDLTFTPDDNAKVFDGKDGTCADPAGLVSLVPDAVLKPDAEKKTFSLSIPRLPSGTVPKDLCYRCQPKGNTENGTAGSADDKGCNFRIECRKPIRLLARALMGHEAQNQGPASSQLLEEALHRKPFTPALSAEKRIKVSKADEELKLKCNGGLAFKPQKDKQVFNDKDGQCKNQETLGSRVRNAVMTHGEAATPTYSLKVPHLPSGSEDKALCCECFPKPDKESLQAEAGCTFLEVQRADQAAESAARDLRSAEAALFSIFASGLAVRAATALR
ncbi:SAG-related sequence [Besnoitia besnoiti]|uniref:SAG-related sequence n=1 Tax=Besnoitia besnoiti TaxID=94643 RepID=A0A2A9MF46_BESBE|nr:SAG-related sequence [Besnoitia besnoiti]PFH33990.1 SAG-related sequence [Besnoitia besnoiti]